MLVFYLLVDKDDIPIIIDQPEENLDNQTIFKVLVKCTKAAKQRKRPTNAQLGSARLVS